MQQTIPYLPRRSQARVKHACGCRVPRQHVIGRKHDRHLQILPSQSGSSKNLTNINDKSCAANRVVDRSSHFSESRNIQNSHKLVHMLAASKGERVRNSLSSQFEHFLSSEVPSGNHESSQHESKTISSSCQNLFSVNLIDTQILTLTKPCQSERFALPPFIAVKILGTFLMPCKCLCIVEVDTKFSGRRKHSTASWRALIVEIDIEGRKSQVRKRERPRVVLVLFKIPESMALQLNVEQRLYSMYQKAIGLLLFFQSALMHGPRLQIFEVS